MINHYNQLALRPRARQGTLPGIKVSVAHGGNNQGKQ